MQDIHEGMWDCIEYEDYKQLTHRRLSKEERDMNHITVYECRDCGQHWVAETWYKGEMGETVDFVAYGESDVDEILADYGL